MIRYSISDTMPLFGMPFSSEGVNRLPECLRDRVSGNLWECAASQSGARLCFMSDTTLFGLSGTFPDALGTHNMHVRGRAGLDVYIDGGYAGAFFPTAPGHAESVIIERLPRALRRYTVYLPIYGRVDSLRVLLDDDAALLPPPPFARALPAVFYGTSITQGGCASHPALSYPAWLCRDLNLDFVNLGFSGLGRGERVVAEQVAGIPASCYVLDFVQNNPTIEEFEEAYYRFYHILRDKNPDTPVVMTAAIPYAGEGLSQEFIVKQTARRRIAHDAYERGLAGGDKNLHMMDWYQALDFGRGDAQVDGAHPNDYGFFLMKEALKPLLKQILSL